MGNKLHILHFKRLNELYIERVLHDIFTNLRVTWKHLSYISNANTVCHLSIDIFPEVMNHCTEAHSSELLRFSRLSLDTDTEFHLYSICKTQHQTNYLQSEKNRFRKINKQEAFAMFPMRISPDVKIKVYKTLLHQIEIRFYKWTFPCLLQSEVQRNI